MVGGEARAGLDEPGEAVGDRDRDSGGDEGALARAELDALAGGQVETGVTGVGAGGDDRAGVEAADLELDQAVSRCTSSTRKGANRRSSPRVRRARRRTPSGVSSRWTIGAPSPYSSDSRPPSS